jgi:hypothetical protein
MTHEPGTRYVLQLADGDTWQVTTCTACAAVVANGDWQTHADWAAQLEGDENQ